MVERGRWIGLEAENWELFIKSWQVDDFDFWRQLLEQSPGPALDVGCGTGRLLVPMLLAGLEVDGLDISPDLLAICQTNLEREGLHTRLYEQAMQELDLPQRYQSILVPCQAFFLVVDRTEAIETLDRFYRHLKPGGMLAFNLPSPYETDDSEGDTEPLIEEGWTIAARRDRPDGSQLEEAHLVEQRDRLDQTMIGKARFRILAGGKVIAEEIYPWYARTYYRNEMLAMLESAGFSDIRVYGFRTETFTLDHDQMIFVARK